MGLDTAASARERNTSLRARGKWCESDESTPQQARAVRADEGAKGGDNHMLVLTRKSNQSIMIGDDIEVSVLSIMGEKVRIGIQAPRDIPVFRREVYLEIQEEREEGRQDEEARSPAANGVES
jgi:carbon storage regulator